jgi:hypothetical protein
MIALTRITRWALRAAARRWPAALRDEMSREWHAELTDLESRPGTAARQLGYAFSLLTSPPVHDAAGVPQGWGRARGSGSAAGAGAGFALLAVAVAGTVLWGFVEQYLLDWETVAFGWAHYLMQGLAIALWCVPAGWWLGRRLPMSRDGRFGAATPAVLAPVVLVLAVLNTNISDPGLGMAIAAVVWCCGTAAMGWAVVRAATRSRRALAGVLAVAGVPLVSAVAIVLSTVPLVFSWPTGIGAGLEAAKDSLLMNSDVTLPEGVHSFAMVGSGVFLYTAYGWLAVAYGLRAAFAVRKPEPAPAPAAIETARPAVPIAALIAGAVAVAGGAVAWAYTVTVLTPDLPVWSANAPMPGGDGEIYLWAAELRWTAILLAVLGLTVAAANRRSAIRGVVVLAAGLLTAESVLLSQEAAGVAGMRTALIVAALLIGVAWIAAGRVPAGTAAPVRRRMAVAAVVASGCGPMLYFQSTPHENHPYMPLGLPLTTALVAVCGVLLGTVTAASSRRLRPAAVAALIGVPVAVLAALGPYLGNGDPGTVAMWGSLLGLPLAVVVAGVLRRHRARRRGLTTGIWVALTVVGAPMTVPVVFASFALLMVVPSLLFTIDGTSYPADGLSVVPGAMVLLIPAGLLVSYREGGAPKTAVTPDPGPLPEPRPGNAAEPDGASAAMRAAEPVPGAGPTLTAAPF